MTGRPSIGSEGKGTGFCIPFLNALPVTGAAISVFGGSIQETTIDASDELSAKLDELQFDLGEGPRWDAMRSRQPVAVPQVRSAAQAMWPVFAKSLLETDVQALFVYPLTLGAINIGVVELYSRSPGSLSHREHITALGLAERTAWSLLARLLTSGPDEQADWEEDRSPLSRREIHQATGMVLVQAGVTATEALLLLRGHAFTQGQTVEQVAGDVVARRLDLTPLDEKE